MSVGVTSNNVTIKIKSRVSAGYTVGAGEHVKATYAPYTFGTTNVAGLQVDYGPGDTVTSTISTTTGGSGTTVTLSLIAATCFQNSP